MAEEYTAFSSLHKTSTKKWKLPLLLLACSCLTPLSKVHAAVVVASGNTNVYNSQNGVPVVDIATPNSSGLSHNRYLDYNVNSNGLVLNNGDSTQMSRQSQLAGQVMANLNLVPGHGADLILNEVVSNNRSVLAGFTEVLGKTADVVVANPNGITCNGCGFINTPNVTLTTGTPQLTAGALTSFNVVGGDILISGTGINATNQDYLALVARKLKFEGPINGKEMDIVAGSNTWNHVSRTAASNTPSGSTPDYAIDSTALGGMYANKIRIIATEAGVGVRLLGDVAAIGTDFTITAAGKVQIDSKISAQRDIAVATTSNLSNSINLNNANVTASRNISMTATGGLDFSGSAIVASNNFTINAASLSDESSASSIADNNKRYSGNALSITLSGAATVNGTNWGSGAGFNSSSGSFTVGNSGATLYSSTVLDMSTTTGAMVLRTLYLQSVGDMTLTSASTFSTESSESQGIRVTTGNLQINSVSGLTNAGTITTDTGGVVVRTGGTLTNSGTIHGKTTLNIADYSSGSTENITNSGAILSESAGTIIATTITNSGNWQHNTGTTLTATTLTNSGNFITSTNTANSGTLNLTTLTNQSGGILQSAKTLTLNILSTITNSGKMIATDDITIRASGSGTTLSIVNNSGAVIQASDVLDIAGTSGGTNVALTTQAGTIIANDISLSLNNATNTGTLQAEHNLTISLADYLTNSGTMLAKNTASIAIPTITNSGTIQGSYGITFSGTTLTNSGSIIGSTDSASSATFTLSTLTNQVAGVIQSAKNLILNVLTSITNSGKLLASDDLTIRGTNSGTTLAIVNNSGGTVQATDLLDIKGVGDGDKASITTQAGNLIADRLGFNLTSFANSSTTQGGTGASTVSVANTLTNSGSLILATSVAGSGTINADTIANTGTIQSEATLALNLATALNNTSNGKVLSTGNMIIRGQTGSTYSISNNSRIQSGGVLSIKGNSNGVAVNISTTSSSAILLGDTADINATTISMNDGSTFSTVGAMTVAANSLTFGGSSAAIVASTGGSGSSTITISSAFSNNAAIHSGYNLTFNAPSITNTSTGGFSALNNLTVNGTGGNFDNYGALYAASVLTVSSTATFTNRETTGTMDSGGNIVATAATFTNNNTMNSTSNITITAATFRNEITSGIPARQFVGTRYSENTSSTYEGDFLGFIIGTTYQHYTKTWYEQQTFVSTPSSNRAQLIAGATLTVNFANGFNTASTMSGTTINLNGSGSFTNEDLSLERRDYTETWQTRQVCYLLYCDTFNNEGDYTSYNTSTYSRGASAGIYSTTLNATGFSLYNNSSPYASTVNTRSASGASSSGLGSVVNSVSGAGGVSGTTTVSGASAINFGGLVITLPTNPNGYFVPTVSNSSSYLIETNPRFAVGSNFTGSDFIAKRLGVNPDEMQKRLGDANYEGYLVRQQLISQLGTNLINRAEAEAAQMERLMSQGVGQARQMGLTLGKPLTSQQIANLGEDMVWMVEVEVKGQKVLTPVVYLAASTKKMFSDGSVISADNANLDVKSLANTGGTIEGKKTLNITSKDDITNTSGTLKGGDVNLKSTEGSIINSTVAKTTGSGDNVQTTIGKISGIEATGNLKVDAKKDINNLGANMSAGGDASLSAGNNVTFDTVEDKKVSASHGGFGIPLLGSMSSNSIEKSTTQIGSSLSSGGNLKIKAGNDLTLAGTKAKAGGDAELNAGNKIDIIARENSSEKSSSTKNSYVLGSDSSSNSEKTTTNFGSSLEVGKNLKTKSGNDTTIQGSTVSVGGDADINAGRNLNILDGKNTKTSTSSRSQEGLGVGGPGSLYGSTTETTEKYKQDSVGSKISIGGNANLKATNKINVRGSDIAAQGDVNLDAKKVNIVAGENIETSKTTKTTTSVGVYLDKQDNNAGASSGSEAHAERGSASAKAGKGYTGVDAGDSSANASAQADAQASSDTEISFGKTKTETEEQYSLTHSASSIKSGKNMKITASDQLNVIGSDISAGRNMDLKAKDMTFGAAEDIKTTTKSSSETRVGLYVSGKSRADAKAGANATSEDTNVDTGGNAGAKADAGIGVYGTNTTKTSTDGSSKARVSTLKAGGDMTRTAEGSITDVGTKIEAGGNFSQKADEINSLAAADKTWSSSTSETNTAKAGLYAEGKASAKASAEGQGGPAYNSESGTSVGDVDYGAKAKASASAGVKVTYDNKQATSTSDSSKAVVSTIKAGGNISSTSSGKTTLEGTNIEAGGNVALDAKSLEFRAAQDTKSSSKETTSGSAELKVGYGADASAEAGKDKDAKTETGYGMQGSAKGSYAGSTANSNSSKAVVGSIKSGGNTTVTTKEDAKFVGTNIDAKGDANVKAGGNLIFDAARNTESSSSSSQNASAEVNLSTAGGAKTGSLTAAGGYSKSSSDSSTAVTGSIKSGGNLNLSAGKDAKFEGTKLDSGKDASIEAGGNVSFDAAKNTKNSESSGVQAEAMAGNRTTDDKKSSGNLFTGSANGNYSKSSDVTSNTGAINSGGKLNIKAKNDVTFEGIDVTSKDKTSIKAESGSVNFKAAEESSTSVGVKASVGGEIATKSKTKTNDAGENTTTNSSENKEGAIFEAGVKSSKTQKAGSIKSGSLDIDAGKDTTFVGTDIDSKGDATIKAKGNVNFEATETSSVDANLAGKGSSDEKGNSKGQITKAGVGGGVQKQGAKIKSGGNLKINSEGKTTTEGTQIEGNAVNIDAKGGREDESNISGGGDIGFNKIGAGMKVQKTTIKENKQ